MPVPWVAQLVIGLALSYVSYLLAPKPKGPKPPEAKDFEGPTAEAGRPIPVVFGSITLQSPNSLGDWDKEIIKRKAKTDSGGKK